MKTQTLRIIGGRHKRRNISFANIDGLRPTPDRLRETLFNWLMHDIAQANVLDVCAGSGALSWECISRGAAHVTLVEPNRKQVSYLKDAIDELQCQKQTTLIPQKAEVAFKALKKLVGNSPKFDVIFLDPPYALTLWSTLLELLFELELLHADTIIYMEADKPHDSLDISPSIMAKLLPFKETKIGQIYAVLYQIQL